MNDQSAIDAKVQEFSMSAHYKQPRESPTPQRPVYLEIDPNHVRISFNPLEDSSTLNDEAGSLVMKTEDVKKLGLMVGDVLTLRLVKDCQK